MTSNPEAALEGGSYEVIRSRLQQQARALGDVASGINQRRRDEFGGDEAQVLGTDRVRTEHACVPRDVVPIGPYLLMGFNVFLGLKQERAPLDFFSLHRFETTADGFDFSAVAASEAGGFLEDRRFVKEFGELTRYYKDLKLLRLHRTEGRLLVVMQTGQTQRDVKVFRFNVDTQGRATYLDMNGEAEVPKVGQSDLEWRRLGRDDVVTGRHPHMNVFDEVFVETIGGDLTVKVENNTDSGQGIYAEPVVEKDQSLDDAEFHAARAGALIIMKVRPFREEQVRYLVYNARTRSVARIDAVGQACMQLPEDQGLVVPGGYVLQTGEVKVFDGSPADLQFERAIKSPNGEDVLYAFFSPSSGQSLLLSYNLVKKEMASPLPCHGWALWPDGRLVLFRAAGEEAARVHPLQVWKTTYLSAELYAAKPKKQSPLGRIGNADLVRGISDVLTLKRLAESDQPTRRSWEDLVHAAQRCLDAYFWLAQPEVALAEGIKALKSSAELIIDEFEKVSSLQRKAVQTLTEASAQVAELLTRTQPGILHSTHELMEALTSLRTQRGRLITLKEVRSIDRAHLDALEAQCVTQFDAVGQACVAFLLNPEAFAPLRADITTQSKRAEAASRTADLQPVVDALEAAAQGLDLVGEAVASLKAGDADQKAHILESLSEVYGQLNRARGQATSKKKELFGKERRAEFGAQFKLLGQGLESALALADSPEKCDEQLTRLSVQLEELESRFAELDEFATQLAEQREALFEAFEAKKRALVDERQKRAQNLFSAAERIVGSVQRRVKSFTSEDQLNAFFAGDALLEKLRDLVAQLTSLQDPVKADEVESRVKMARQEALRTLRDAKDLFEGGPNVIKLGTHRFNVSTQPVELTVLPKDGALWLHLTGTDLMQRVPDEQLGAFKAEWERTLPSESAVVYRGETLAALVLFAAEAGQHGLSFRILSDAASHPDGLLALVRRFAADRFDEGYERGVHDADAAAILREVIRSYDSAGLLRFSGKARALGLAWAVGGLDEAAVQVVSRRARSLKQLQQTVAPTPATASLASELASRVRAFCEAQKLACAPADAQLAGTYLAEELAAESVTFVQSRDADELLAALAVAQGSQRQRFIDDLAALPSLADRVALATAWVQAVAGAGPLAHAVDEAAMTLALPLAPRRQTASLTGGRVEGLLGNHPRIVDRTLEVRIDAFLTRLSTFVRESLPAFHAFRAQVRQLVDAERVRLRIEELVPKVLSSFVRNQLIDEVYLPLIGKNLAKQLGAAGEDKRTDRMGMLLLISPPGYGKTTLMEYVASRLGLVFVKVNGPALGHGVTSLDPAEAPNATSRQEVERINLAFELGNNVMLYLDDIQHTSAELLQKFISLCDAQRKVEGVWGGRTRTYDFRGKKFCVVMAGNPYTETGETFRIPDMLANRADTYNLGDMVDGTQQAFSQSYLENALTSNTVLAPLAARSLKDVRTLIRMARGEEVPSSELEHRYSGVELEEVLAVLRHLAQVQATLLRVNAQYIASAAQDERFRTEPPFKLQGSYRNMNKLAEKVVAGMTSDEVEKLIDGHYGQEAQTLTSAAEQNILKLAELRGRLTPKQQQRWIEIQKSYQRVKLMGGRDDDPVARVTGSLALLATGLERIGASVAQGSSLGGVEAQLSSLHQALSARASQEPSVDWSQLSKVLEPLVAARNQPPADGQVADAVLSIGKVLAAWAKRAEAGQNSIATALMALSGSAASKPTPPAVPEDLAVRLSMLAEHLNGMERAARSALQEGDDGLLRARPLWQQVKEAMDLLKALGVARPRG